MNIKSLRWRANVYRLHLTMQAIMTRAVARPHDDPHQARVAGRRPDHPAVDPRASPSSSGCSDEVQAHARSSCASSCSARGRSAEVVIARIGRRRRRLRAVLPQLLDVPRRSPGSISRICTCGSSSAARAAARRCCVISRSWRSSAAAGGSNGRCSTGTSRAIDFYKSLGAVPMDQWTVHRVTGDALTKLGAGGL